MPEAGHISHLTIWPSWMSTQQSTQWVWGLAVGVRWPGYECDRYPHWVCRLRMWHFTSITPYLMVWCFINHWPMTF